MSSKTWGTILPELSFQLCFPVAGQKISGLIQQTGSPRNRFWDL